MKIIKIKKDLKISQNDLDNLDNEIERIDNYINQTLGTFYALNLDAETIDIELNKSNKQIAETMGFKPSKYKTKEPNLNFQQKYDLLNNLMPKLKEVPQFTEYIAELYLQKALSTSKMYKKTTNKDYLVDAFVSINFALDYNQEIKIKDEFRWLTKITKKGITKSGILRTEKDKNCLEILLNVSKEMKKKLGDLSLPYLIQGLID